MKSNLPGANHSGIFVTVKEENVHHVEYNCHEMKGKCFHNTVITSCNTDFESIRKRSRRH